MNSLNDLLAPLPSVAAFFAAISGLITVVKPLFSSGARYQKKAEFWREEVNKSRNGQLTAFFQEKHRFYLAKVYAQSFFNASAYSWAVVTAVFCWFFASLVCMALTASTDTSAAFMETETLVTALVLGTLSLIYLARCFYKFMDNTLRRRIAFEAVVNEKQPPSATGALPRFRRGVLSSALFAGGAVCLGSFLAFTLAALTKDAPIDTAAAPYAILCALLLVLAFSARGYWYDNVTTPDLRDQSMKQSDSAYLFLRKRRNHGVGEPRG
ncbi:hypothetical protein [Glutamicibacter halophytocola]|uniref:hypothetical protein n=1 Tax=Glutamicibacter halophytocola TaxID=1933880 RepID=UPI001892CEDE|nr:hypothetical protein [Glutamicibacter halophytocola]